MKKIVKLKNYGIASRWLKGFFVFAATIILALPLLNFSYSEPVPGNKEYPGSADSVRSELIISGTWQFLEILAVDSSNPQLGKKADTLLGKTIYISPELVALLKDSCFDPDYEIIPRKFMGEYQQKNYIGISFSVVCGQCSELKLIQMVCKGSLKNRINHKTGYDVFYISDKQIAIDIEGKLYLLEREETIVKTIPHDGDTVRCLYRESRTCTGFLIQGTRKAGRVIHVNPENKNVPLEVEEK